MSSTEALDQNYYLLLAVYVAVVLGKKGCRYPFEGVGLGTGGVEPVCLPARQSFLLAATEGHYAYDLVNPLFPGQLALHFGGISLLHVHFCSVCSLMTTIIFVAQKSLGISFSL